MSSSTEIVLFLQHFPALIPLMKALTVLGNEEFFLLLLPLVYLCIDRRAGLRLGCIVVLGDALNAILKVGCAQPRPYWIDARVQQWVSEASYGFPSSHAQNATAVWCWIAGQLNRNKKRVWLWPAAISLAAAIAVSRLFLGVHFGGDVIGGALIGLVFLGVFARLEPLLADWWRRQNLVSQAMLATASTTVLIGIFFVARKFGAPSTTVSWARFAIESGSAQAIVSRAGTWWGLLVGAAVAGRYARFEVDGGIGLRVQRFVGAIIGVGVCWKGLALVFPGQPEAVELSFRFVRYALLTLWITWGAPALFLKIGWLSAHDSALKVL